MGRSVWIFLEKKLFKKNSLFGLIFLSFECIKYIFFSKKRLKKKTFFLNADSGFQDFWVGRKGQYNIFFV